MISISENLIEQYRALYAELDVPEHQRTLQRLQQVVFTSTPAPENTTAEAENGQKGGFA